MSKRFIGPRYMLVALARDTGRIRTFRRSSLQMLRAIASDAIQTQAFACVEIVNVETLRTVETFIPRGA